MMTMLGFAADADAYATAQALINVSSFISRGAGRFYGNFWWTGHHPKWRRFCAQTVVWTASCRTPRTIRTGRPSSGARDVTCGAANPRGAA